jgi:hypothetical protein
MGFGSGLTTPARLTTIGDGIQQAQNGGEAAIKADYWFLRVRCPACRTTGDVDLHELVWHQGVAVTALISRLSCRSCRPNAPFAELVRLSRLSMTDEWNV